MRAQCKVVVLQSVETRKSERHRPRREVIAMLVNKGKVYPYNSVKRGWK